MNIADEVAKQRIPEGMCQDLEIAYPALVEYGALCFEIGLKLGKSCRLARLEQGEDSYKVELTDYCDHCLYQVRLIEQAGEVQG